MCPGSWFASILLALAAWPATGQEVVVLSNLDEAIGWLESENWWGAEKHEQQLQVPYAMITGISPRWQNTAQQIPVTQKKEVFYRFMLPLIMHANSMVLDRRARLTRIRDTMASGHRLEPEDLDWLHRTLVVLRIADEDSVTKLSGSIADLYESVNQALYRLDVIPAGLALGQAAYESGYGTSRFAAQGNALFGQWTFGGKGLVPEQQRSSLGDHRIASFRWPFDSVRAYFLNLSAHPAYEDFRRLRANLKAAGKPVTSLALADGLIRYSERGQEYVDTLKSIIRVNGLDIADHAVFRDEPMRFLVATENEADADILRDRIEAMRSSGELEGIIARMRLD